MGLKREAKHVAKLTNELVKQTPLATGQAFNIYDTDQRGFCLRVTPTGKSFGIRVKIRGKEYQRSIAIVGGKDSITASAARERAKTLIGNLVDGIDQKAIDKAEKEARKAAESEAERVQLETLTLSSALDRYLPVALNRDGKPLKERTKADYLYLMKHELKDYASTPLQDIDRDLVDSMRSNIVNDRGPTRASHALRLVRTLCRKNKTGLQAWEKLIPKGNVRKTGLRPHDGKILFDALSGMTHHSSSSPYVMALLLTGCRRGELANVKVSDVGHDGKTITLADTKNGKPHVIQCSTQLRELVKRLLVDKEGHRRPEDANLFGLCGDPRKTLVNCNRIVKNAADAASDLNGTAIVDKSFSLHDLRKLCAITLNHLRLPHATIQAVLNHTPDSGDVTSRHYLGDIDPEELRLAWQALADYYSATAAAVIQLPTARAA